MLKKIKSGYLAACIAVASPLIVAEAHATSVLTTETKTAMTSGFTDIKDTALDIFTSGLPFFLAMIAVIAVPRMIKSFAKTATR